MPFQNKIQHQIFNSHVFGILDNYKNRQKIFTDASKSNEGVGIATIFENSNITYKLTNEYSIFLAKALVILKAIEIIINMEHTNFVILCDSLSVINSIKNKTNLTDIAVPIKNKLDETKTDKKQILLI